MRYFYKMRSNPENLFLVRNDVQISMYFFFLLLEFTFISVGILRCF